MTTKKKLKKCCQLSKFKMVTEFKMAHGGDIVFSSLSFNYDNFSKKTFLLTKNAIFVQPLFFQEIQNGG
jgi:hypothetical protein